MLSAAFCNRRGFCPLNGGSEQLTIGDKEWQKTREDKAVENVTYIQLNSDDSGTILLTLDGILVENHPRTVRDIMVYY